MLEWFVFLIVEGIEEVNFVCMLSLKELCDMLFCYLLVLVLSNGVK